MTPAEFKSWFEGFTEAFAGCPTKAQWARIRDRVAEIDGKAVTEHVYVDRYIRHFSPQYISPQWPYWQGLGGVNNQDPSYLAVAQNRACVNNESGFSGLTAMNALGRAEAASLTS